MGLTWKTSFPPHCRSIWPEQPLFASLTGWIGMRGSRSGIRPFRKQMTRWRSSSRQQAVQAKPRAHSCLWSCNLSWLVSCDGQPVELESGRDGVKAFRRWCVTLPPLKQELTRSGEVEVESAFKEECFQTVLISVQLVPSKPLNRLWAQVWRDVKSSRSVYSDRVSGGQKSSQEQVSLSFFHWFDKQEI